MLEKYYNFQKLKKSGAGWLACCPFHDDNNPSFSFSNEGLYRCYSCGESGNSITFRKKLNIPIDDFQKKNEDTFSIIDPFLSRYNKKIPKIVFTILDFYTFTYFDKKQEQKVFCLGLKTADGWTKRIELRGEKLRWLYPSTARYPQAKKGSFIGKIKDDTDTLILCEGEWDCFILLSNGYSAITLGGNMVGFPKHHLEKIKDKNIILAYDFDEAGKKGEQKLKLQLENKVKSIKKLDWEKTGFEYLDKKGKDIEDFFSTHSKNDFDKLLSEVIEIEQVEQLERVSLSGMPFEDKRETILSSFTNHGTFFKDKKDKLQLYWFCNYDNCVHELTKNNELLSFYIHDFFDINKERHEYKEIIHSLRAYCSDNAEEKTIYKISCFLHNKLYIHIEKNEVIVLEKDTFFFQKNGDEVFFTGCSTIPKVIPSKKNMFLKFFFNTFFFEKDILNEKEQTSIFFFYFLSFFFSNIFKERPILVAKGEHGSGKSKALSILLKIFDENKSVITMGKDRKDIVASMQNNKLLFFDNVDEKLPGEIQDLLASMATGANYSARKLYSNFEQVEIEPDNFLGVTTRTYSFNRADLLDRSLYLNFKRIDETERKTDTELLAPIVDNKKDFWSDIFFYLQGLLKKITREDKPRKKKYYLRATNLEQFWYDIAPDITDKICRKMSLFRYAQNLEFDFIFNLIMDEVSNNEDDIIYFSLDKNYFYSYLQSLDHKLPTKHGFLKYLNRKKNDYSKVFDYFNLINRGRKQLIQVIHTKDNFTGSIKKIKDRFENEEVGTNINALKQQEPVY